MAVLADVLLMGGGSNSNDTKNSVVFLLLNCSVIKYLL
jgi:hypothetical protein